MRSLCDAPLSPRRSETPAAIFGADDDDDDAFDGVPLADSDGCKAPPVAGNPAAEVVDGTVEAPDGGPVAAAGAGAGAGDGAGEGDGASAGAGEGDGAEAELNTRTCPIEGTFNCCDCVASKKAMMSSLRVLMPIGLGTKPLKAHSWPSLV
mmetsp:Transcript_9534/g.31359  ORF Transcript_9534/g.31359 Transcript_9534/m.31359 type:complete len:151 (-) Transcript_9534:3214-3666(-)